ncbi:hypothetical protein ZWY2020_022097 [Hordeum vulgare]|nr:hypothetical protein ZWY2020_022097 [Hordeum vulgare]
MSKGPGGFCCGGMRSRAADLAGGVEMGRPSAACATASLSSSVDLFRSPRYGRVRATASGARFSAEEGAEKGKSPNPREPSAGSDSAPTGTVAGSILPCGSVEALEEGAVKALKIEVGAATRRLQASVWSGGGAAREEMR